MRLVLTIILFQLANITNAQSVIGFWQENSPEISDAYYNTYEFKNDYTFEFNTNGYFGLSRVISIDGKYKLINNEIQLTVQYTKELVGGRIVRSFFEGTATHLWAIEGGRIKKTTLIIPVKSSIQFEFSKSKKAEDANSQMILLDKHEFFRVQKNK